MLRSLTSFHTFPALAALAGAVFFFELFGSAVKEPRGPGALCSVPPQWFHNDNFDVRPAIRKGLAYLMISGLVAPPYAGTIFLTSALAEPKKLSTWVHLVLLIPFALSVQPLWREVQRSVDRLFYRERYDHMAAFK